MSEVRSLLIQALQQGILPITSQCGAKCLFCSHRFNPPGVRTCSIPTRDIAEISEDLKLVSGLKSVTIGESVTSIMEGEPLCHPQILTILRLVRERYPQAVIKLTTNGVGLNPVMLEAFRTFSPLELTVSLNSCDKNARLKLGLPEAPELLSLLPTLCSYVPWHGSVVAMPHFVGQEEFIKTLEVLCEFGAQTIRVFAPGVTRLSPAELALTPEMHKWVHATVASTQAKYLTPIMFEPTMLTDLAASIEGSITGTPARTAGLTGGEVMLSINGTIPRSRVHAFNLIEQLDNPVIRYKRGITEHSVIITKAKGEKSGLVMYLDMSPMEMDELLETVEQASLIKQKAIVLTSRLGHAMVSQALAHTAAKVMRVDSDFFGGNIAAAGLLTVADFAKALQSESRVNGAVVILPHKAFDTRGRDLLGKSYLDLQVFGCRVVLV